jgi:hypothetical protein
LYLAAEMPNRAIYPASMYLSARVSVSSGLRVKISTTLLLTPAYTIA